VDVHYCCAFFKNRLKNAFILFGVGTWNIMLVFQDERIMYRYIGTVMIYG